jgi:O-antigen ligase
VQAAENANRLAFIALMGIALLWFALRQYGSTILRLVGVPAILVLVLTVFLSGSRSGVLNLGLLLVLLMIQTRVSPGRIVAVILLAAACLAIAYLLVPQPILNRVQTLAGIGDDAALKGAAESTARRVTIFFLGLRLFLEHPVMGVGIGNFRWMTTDDPLFAGAAAHNAYLLTLAEGGVLLFAVYMLLFWWTARDLGWVTRMAVRLPEVGLQWLAFSMRTILVMLLTFSFFAEAWKEFYFVLILATTAVLVRIYRRAAATAPPATA